MARPPKAAGDRRSESIRIPVSAEEKRLITEAGGAANSSGYTAWARDLLLAAAQGAEQPGKPKSRRKAEA